jgi:glycosyltransferase involved in cell wall biosynthesis
MSSLVETHSNMPARIARHSARPPAVSVIIHAYNVSQYISEALESVVAQEFRDYEIIVINDGSADTPELERVLEPLREDIVYLKQNNRGAAAARNTALFVARGEFVAFLDADDSWHPDFLSSQMSFIGSRKNCDLVYADACLFGESPLAGKTYMQTTPSKGEVTFESLLTARCNVITSGVVARRQAILDVGLFDEDLLRAHDFDLWLRMLRHGTRAAYQKKILLNYRIRSDSLSGDAIQRVERELEAYDKIERHLELTTREKGLIAKMVRRLQADLRIEQGKAALTRKEYETAAVEFRASFGIRRNWKLPFVLTALRISPEMLLQVYLKRRTHVGPYIERIRRAILFLVSGVLGL